MICKKNLNKSTNYGIKNMTTLYRPTIDRPTPNGVNTSITYWRDTPCELLQRVRGSAAAVRF